MIENPATDATDKLIESLDETPYALEAVLYWLSCDPVNRDEAIAQLSALIPMEDRLALIA